MSTAPTGSNIPPQSSQDPVTGAPPKSPATPRLMSVDALRGFDMFWIIGADALVYALHRMTPNRATTFLADQLEHVPWAGFHFYDLIFPLFVFIVGVSLVFSLSKTIAQAGRPEALKRIIRRSILLFVIALLYSGGVTEPWPNIRLLGVLNRIALCYFFASLLFCFCKPRVLVATCVALLAGYWALMTFAPIRDIYLIDPARTKTWEILIRPSATVVTNGMSRADVAQAFAAAPRSVTRQYQPGLNLANHLDYQYLPGKKYDIYWDPEGLLSTIPAVATCLLGVLAGLFLQCPLTPAGKKVISLFAAGAILLALGFVWSLQFPIVKKIWTSSFVLVAGGFSALLLGAFYLVVDVWKKQRWCQPCVWMGMNSITIYLASNLLGGFRKVALRFAGGDVKTFFDAHVASGMGDLVVALVGLALAFCFVGFLHRKKIFLRL